MKLKKINKSNTGKCLKLLRNEKRVTLEHLADIMNLSKTNVWQMEKGISVPNFESICFFTKYYQFDFIFFEPIFEEEEIDEKSLKYKMEQHRIDSKLKGNGSFNAEESRLKDMVIELQNDVIQLHKELVKEKADKGR